MTAKNTATHRKQTRRPSANSNSSHFWRFFFPLLGCLAAGFTSVLLLASRVAPTDTTPMDWLPLGIAVLLPLSVSLLLKIMRFRGDFCILWITLLLAGLGLLFKSRTGGTVLTMGLPNWLWPLLIGSATLAIVALAFQGAGRKILQLFSPLAWIATLVLLSSILILGSRYRGMVYLAGNMNPSEACKPLLVLALAGFFASHAARNGKITLGLREYITLGFLWSLPMGLLLFQRDLGMIIQLNATLLLMIFAATGQPAWLIGGGAALVGCGYALVHFNLHGSDRIVTWLHPYRDPTGKGWQVLQSLSAQYTGGLTGTGLGSGSPQSVPIVSSDFIYAAIAEETGYIGCALLILAYLLLFARASRTAAAQQDPFARLLVAGLVFSLALQTIFNLAGATKTLPMTGIPLPLISHGGSSLATSLAMIGLILAHTVPPAKRRQARKDSRS